MEKKYVKIQSSMNIAVTPGLQYSDYTKKDSDLPNRFNIKARWHNASVEIKTGAHYYPAEIVKWNTVKALADKGILTIGEYVESIPDSKLADEAEKVEAKYEKGKSIMEANAVKKTATKKLSEIGE